MPVIKYNAFDIDKLAFTELKDSDQVQSQKIAWINYNGTQLIVQTPVMRFESGGIPRESQYYPDPASRAKANKIAFCHDRSQDKNTEIFYNMLVDIDKLCGSDEFREKVFGKNKNKYKYQPIIRIPEIDDENIKLDKNGNPYYQPPWTKAQYSLKRNTDIPDFTVIEKVNGVRTTLKFDNFAEVEKFITWKSDIRYIIKFSKLYAMKTNSGNDKKGYGITLKITSIEIERPISVKNNQESDAFIDSDDDEPINNNETITRNTENLDIKNDEEDEEEVVEVEEEVVEESEEEVIEKPKSKSKSKSKAK